jgi:hypothetical protein
MGGVFSHSLGRFYPRPPGKQKCLESLCHKPLVKIVSVLSRFYHVTKKPSFVRRAASVTLGSLPPFAAFAHETNAKPEGEWRQCGQNRRWWFSEPYYSRQISIVDR